MPSETNPPPMLPPEAKMIGTAASRKPGIRFSMKSLLIAMTGVAVICGLSIALPAEISLVFVGLIWFAITGLIFTTLFFASGEMRAFSIGAAIVASSMWTGIGGQFFQGIHRVLYFLLGGTEVPRGLAAWVDLLVIIVAAIANAVFCVHVKRFIDRHNQGEK
ncbi:hypothetical protein [Adhaeretor mobilis]|uniref:Uncharacterized protein n=1 Tax=Adhaeretor mobilis TaxID=1930276 RepID=A0A517MYM7_9BACT|nr:hypothetical protein [Adhaeretor mobilis]QDS99969.1 hypothetical protein HG15A2_33030 [Adhaeretor mobilis]